jgi:lipocalin
MYLMTRQRQPSDMLIEKCLAKAAANGFDMGKVLVVQHN